MGPGDGGLVGAGRAQPGIGASEAWIVLACRPFQPKGGIGEGAGGPQGRVRGDAFGQEGPEGFTEGGDGGVVFGLQRITDALGFSLDFHAAS